MSAAALPLRPGPQGPLRVLLPARRRPRRAAAAPGSATRSSSAPAARRPARCGARCSRPGSEPRAVKQSLPDPRPGDWLTIGDSHFGPRGAQRAGRGAGASRAVGPDASARPPRRSAPAGAAVRRAAPAHEAREPAARHDDLRPRRGLGARRLARHGRPQLGRRARRALDLAARRLRGRADAWLDVALGRVKVGPLTTPWIANGALQPRRRAAADRRAGRARAWTRARTAARSRSAACGSRCAAPQLVSWIYADPSGGEHRSTNCSIAARRAHRRRPHAAHRARRRVGARHARGAARRRGPALPGPVDRAARRATARHRRRRPPARRARSAERRVARRAPPAGSERPTISCLRRSSSIRGWSRG